jgi:hypothetical protein
LKYLFMGTALSKGTQSAAATATALFCANEAVRDSPALNDSLKGSV